MDVLVARVVVVVRTGAAEVVTVSACSVAAVARVFTTTTARVPHWLEKGPSLGWLGSHLVNSYCNQPLSAPSQ